MGNETAKQHDRYNICFVISFCCSTFAFQKFHPYPSIKHKRSSEWICDHVQSDTVTGCCNIIALAKKPYSPHQQWKDDPSLRCEQWENWKPVKRVSEVQAAAGSSGSSTCSVPSGAPRASRRFGEAEDCLLRLGFHKGVRSLKKDGFSGDHSWMKIRQSRFHGNFRNVNKFHEFTKSSQKGQLIYTHAMNFNIVEPASQVKTCRNGSFNFKKKTLRFVISSWWGELKTLIFWVREWGFSRCWIVHTYEARFDFRVMIKEARQD